MPARTAGILVLEVLAKSPHGSRLMETALNSPDGVEQFLAARFFAGNRQYAERVVPILLKAMDNPDIRIAAVGVLGGMQGAARTAVPVLEAELVRQTEINSHSQETLLLREALSAINNG